MAESKDVMESALDLLQDDRPGALSDDRLQAQYGYYYGDVALDFDLDLVETDGIANTFTVNPPSQRTQMFQITHQDIQQNTIQPVIMPSKFEQIDTINRSARCIHQRTFGRRSSSGTSFKFESNSNTKQLNPMNQHISVTNTCIEDYNTPMEDYTENFKQETNELMDELKTEYIDMIENNEMNMEWQDTKNIATPPRICISSNGTAFESILSPGSVEKRPFLTQKEQIEWTVTHNEMQETSLPPRYLSQAESEPEKTRVLSRTFGSFARAFTFPTTR